MLTIFLVVFVDLVGFGIVIPILPYYAQAYGASALQLGFLMMSYSLMQFLVAPLWGKLSDRIGRRPVLLVSIFGTCLSLIALGFAQSLSILFIARTFAGICGANISTAYAYIADVTDEKNRAKGMGMIGAAFGLGFVLGPAIGGTLSHYGYGAPMFAGAALSALNFIFAFFRLKEPKLAADVRASHRSRRFDRSAWRSALGAPVARQAILTFFLVTFAVTQMEVSFALFLKARFSYDAFHAGLLLAVLGTIMVIIQGGLIGKLATRFGESRLIQLGVIVCALALVLFGLSFKIPFVLVALISLAIGHGVLHPSLSSLASKGAATDAHGSVMGVFQSAGSLARVVGPPAAGFLFDTFSSGAPFFGGALVLTFAFVYFRSVKI